MYTIHAYIRGRGWTKATAMDRETAERIARTLRGHVVQTEGRGPSPARGNAAPRAASH